MLIAILIVLLLVVLTKRWLVFKSKRYKTVIQNCLEIYVISLNGRENKQLERLFPNVNIKIQTGVDIRNVSTENVLKSNIIDKHTYDTIVNGRTYHHEIASHGAIGVAWANKLVFDKGDCDLFLFEEDYKIIYERKLVEEVAILQRNRKKFDVAVFGAIVRGKDSIGRNHVIKPVPWMPKGWVELNGGRFFLLHAVYYTSSARKAIRLKLY